MNVDTLLKSLAERYPDQFATWLLGVPVEILGPIEVLKTELGGEPIRADFVAFLRGTHAILHVEFLFSRPRSNETPAPLRMLDYWVRLHRQYGVDIHQVLVMIARRSGSDPGVFEHGETRHVYRVVRLWEENPAPILSHEGLLPLAVLAQTADRRALISDVAARLRRIEPAERREDMAAAATLLAGLVFNWKEIHTMFGENDWYKESSAYQHFHEEGVAEGLAEGRTAGLAEGLAAGQAQGALLLLVGVIESRFGTVPLDLRATLGRCPLEVLQQLAPVAATCGSIEAFGEAVGAVAPAA